MKSLKRITSWHEVVLYTITTLVFHSDDVFVCFTEVITYQRWTETIKKESTLKIYWEKLQKAVYIECIAPLSPPNEAMPWKVIKNVNIKH